MKDLLLAINGLTSNVSGVKTSLTEFRSEMTGFRVEIANLTTEVSNLKQTTLIKDNLSSAVAPLLAPIEVRLVALERSPAGSDSPALQMFPH